MQQTFVELQPVHLEIASTVECSPRGRWHIDLEHELLTLQGLALRMVGNRVRQDIALLAHQLETEAKHVQTSFFGFFEQLLQTARLQIVVAVHEPDIGTVRRFQSGIAGSTESSVLLVDDDPGGNRFARLLLLAAEGFEHLHRVIGSTVIDGNDLIIFGRKALVSNGRYTSSKPFTHIVNGHHNTKSHITLMVFNNRLICPRTHGSMSLPRHRARPTKPNRTHVTSRRCRPRVLFFFIAPVARIV